MRTIRKRLDQVMRILTTSILLIITALTVWQVFTRYLLGVPSTWSEEVSAYLFVWLTVLGAAYVFGQRDHMNIPLLEDKLKPKSTKILNIFAEVVTLVFTSLVMVYGGIMITQLTMSQFASSITVPMGYFYSTIPISGIFIILYNILNIYDLVKASKSLEEE